jgi:transformation/transcription domain-associated protein
MAPYVEPCLSLALSMLAGPLAAEQRPLLLELCLTLPAQLTGVLPLLPRLVRPVTMAIRVSGGRAPGVADACRIVFVLCNTYT